MDYEASENLREAVSGHITFMDQLMDRVRQVATFLPAYRADAWDMIMLVRSLSASYRLAQGTIHSDLPWTRLYYSTLVDGAVYGRGLLLQALMQAVYLDLLHDEADVRPLVQLLFRGHRQQRMVVAYIDMLGVTGRGKGLWGFFELNLDLARKTSREGLSFYHWRSSDTFYLFAIDTDEQRLAAKTSSLIRVLVWIQKQVRSRTKEGEKDWMWQMGVSDGENVALGDILLPREAGILAAELMKDAISANRRDGGEILVTDGVHKLLEMDPSGREIAQEFDSVPGRRIKIGPKYSRDQYWILSKDSKLK